MHEGVTNTFFPLLDSKDYLVFNKLITFTSGNKQFYLPYRRSKVLKLGDSPHDLLDNKILESLKQQYNDAKFISPSSDNVILEAQRDNFNAQFGNMKHIQPIMFFFEFDFSTMPESLRDFVRENNYGFRISFLKLTVRALNPPQISGIPDICIEYKALYSQKELECYCEFESNRKLVKNYTFFDLIACDKKYFIDLNKKIDNTEDIPITCNSEASQCSFNWNKPF